MSELPTTVGATFRVREVGPGGLTSGPIMGARVITRPLTGKSWIRQLMYQVAGESYTASQMAERWKVVVEPAVLANYALDNGLVVPRAAVNAVMCFAGLRVMSVTGTADELSEDDAANIVLSVLQAVKTEDDEDDEW